eukprot:GAHX01001580.1.p1 GENE.GAHX01001580.1~~GAHX01001580.1.p1  ORF type:complete len:475 (-),score=84.26 GAHX01001580.1:269-1693(-)
MENLSCCVCGSEIAVKNTHYMCLECIDSEIQYNGKINREYELEQCRQCEQFQRTKKEWVDLGVSDGELNEFGSFITNPYETQPLMDFALTKIKKSKGFSIHTSEFIPSDPYSKILQINVFVSWPLSEIFHDKEYVYKKAVTFYFNVVNKQCDECKMSFTPHNYNSILQLRQRPNVKHMRILIYLEQILVKNYVNQSGVTPKYKELSEDECTEINPPKENFKKLKKEKRKPVINDLEYLNDGINVTFIDYNGANKAACLLRQFAPVLSEKVTSKLLTHDPKNNTQKRNKTVLLEIFPINKGDLVLYKLNKEYELYVCSRVSSKIFLGNVKNNKKLSLSVKQLKRADFKMLKSKGDLEKYKIVDIQDVSEKEEAQMMADQLESKFLNIKVMQDGKSEIYDCKWGFWSGQSVQEGDYIDCYNVTGILSNDNEIESYFTDNDFSIIPTQKTRIRKPKTKKAKIIDRGLDSLQDVTLNG